MIAARDRLAVAALTTALTGDFDLPTLLDTAAHDACAGFGAVSAAVILLDDHRRAGDTGVEVVAEALSSHAEVDLRFLTNGPALDSARGGAVTMIADLADAADTRWPSYRRDALQAGMRAMRSFPVIVLGASVGALVVHTPDPWGSQRSNELGVILANLIAVAISMGNDSGRRHADTSETIQTLLRGTVAIATATGVIAEKLSLEPARARLHLHRLARAHQNTVTNHAELIIAAHDDQADDARLSGLLAAPTLPPAPPRINT
ncbi:GAF domain-containing protein [Mycolicibacterium tusciae]|uniref:GAF domain-containing protein n=1 Tax=Mycolicibacterium tusciae TaxID=75922 RepID=A0A1X0JM11_9MYCO|nr:GAF domain-containing protein [Mycolicibacterium tusciae]ORB63625.1 hypothetical protein BST47_18810 [Mycolicibacterium tusciae]